MKTHSRGEKSTCRVEDFILASMVLSCGLFVFLFRCRIFWLFRWTLMFCFAIFVGGRVSSTVSVFLTKVGCYKNVCGRFEWISFILIFYLRSDFSGSSGNLSFILNFLYKITPVICVLIYSYVFFRNEDWLSLLTTSRNIPPIFMSVVEVIRRLGSALKPFKRHKTRDTLIVPSPYTVHSILWMSGVFTSVFSKKNVHLHFNN
jgi:hypothetical protein